MLKGIFYSVLNLFVLMFYIQLVCSQLPPDQLRVMTSVYDIFQNDSGASFVWQNVGKNSNPCSWKGVNCTSGNSSINHLSFSKFSISTSEFLPILCSITSLESLDVSNNHLTSILDEFYSDCGKLSELKLLNFSFNGLTGFLPTFNGFSKLEILDFSRNSLRGEIKSELGGLGSLRSLNLGWNWFRGTVPTNLGKIEELRLSGNNLTGVIPVEIARYSNLSVIDLSGNALSGSIPQELGELTRLEILVLSLNSLTGGIPTFLSNITTLRRFAANQNQFRGSIPSGITRNLGVLDLSYNNLTGAIPSDLLSGPNLQSLDLTHNNLQGPIPASSSTKLFRLRLGSNSLNGTIPAESWGSLGELVYLELDNNALSGEIPLALGRWRNLTLLNLGHNRLTGVLPPVLGNLTKLVVLSLEFNNFDGEIPPQISQLNMLSKLNLSSNALNGSMPSSMSSLKNLGNLDLQGNSLSGPIPESIGNLSALIELQLGRNQLSGRIPGMPPKLQIALNLSNNLFEGRIPITLSRLDGLEVLDLSNNKFSGEIPEFLTGLSSLSYLLLADNELTGVVPVFNGYVMLNVTGNDVIVPPPPRGKRPSSPPQRKKKSIASDIIIAVASAFMVVALLIMIGIFISRRYHRINDEPTQSINDEPTQSIEVTSPPQVIHGHLLTPNSIHRSNIDFETAMEAVADPSNITLKTRFSTYYKAKMPSGMNYFVKKLNWSDKVVQFGEELETLGKLCNSNVMIPLAYVMTVDSAYLFYDFSPSGTLFDALHHRIDNTLDWASRYSIAIGVSQGLAFLHDSKSTPILLLDLSSKSILLKSLNEPQVGDIELCKVIDPSKSTGSLSTIADSVGYVPPEYAYTMRVTASANVYSFGVVLLELLTGKPAVSGGTELAKWVSSYSAQRNKWDQILDFSVSKTSAAVRSQMLAVLKVALACVSILPETRPKMKSVLRMLLNAR
ncbi:hypothetical protein ACS0TY_036097 [Phlomoides rotata]